MPASNFCFSKQKQPNLAKYLPNEAYFLLHTENMGQTNGFSERRLIAWMLYLNDVTDGGETEFPTQEIKFKPKAGSMLMWPAYWTHPHRGLPSLTEVKYIATGWFYYLPKGNPRFDGRHPDENKQEIIV